MYENLYMYWQYAHMIKNFLVGDDDIHLPDEQDAMEFGVYIDGFDISFDEEELPDSDDEQDQETQ